MLRIYVMGRIAVEGHTLVDETALPGPLGRTLLAVLSRHPGPVARRRLADILWDGAAPPAVDRSLNPMLSKVRRVLADAGAPADLLTSTAGSVELRRTAGTWIDVEEALHAVDRAEGALRRRDPRAAWPHVAVATAILVRPFLEGIDVTWAAQERRELHEQLIRAREAAVDVWLGLDDAAQAVAAARQLVACDRLRESSHARLIRATMAKGNRAAALLAYHECAAMIRDELGVDPSRVVQDAYEAALHADG